MQKEKNSKKKKKREKKAQTEIGIDVGGKYGKKHWSGTFLRFVLL